MEQACYSLLPALSLNGLLQLVGVPLSLPHFILPFPVSPCTLAPLSLLKHLLHHLNSSKSARLPRSGTMLLSVWHIQELAIVWSPQLRRGKVPFNQFKLVASHSRLKYEFHHSKSEDADAGCLKGEFHRSKVHTEINTV